MNAPLIAGALLCAFPVAGWAQCAAETGKLLAGDGAANDLFGGEVSLSGDTAAVAARSHDHGGVDTGAVYVFVRDGGGWAEQAELVGSDIEPYDRFGPLALDGDLLIVGAEGDDDLGVDSGAAYVFVRVGGSWSEQAKLVPDDLVSGDRFGTSVTVSGDTIVVGSPGDNDGQVDAGSAYVFMHSAGSFDQQAKLRLTSPLLKQHLGTAASLSGHTVALGTQRESVHVFTRTGSVWSEEAELTASDGGVGQRFGRAISLHDDTIVVGANLSGGSGAAYAFARSGTVWTEQAKLFASGLGSGDFFGGSVSVFGETAVVGASWHENRGAAFLFARSGSNWGEAAKISASDASVEDGFGGAVALWGETLSLGAPGDDDQGTRSGSVYVERLLPGPTIYCTAKTNSCGTLPAIEWTGQPSASASSGFTLSVANVRGDKLGLLLYTDAGRASVPFQGGLLCLATPVRRTPLESSGKGPKSCLAEFSIDLNCFASGACGGSPQPYLRVPGTTVNCQWWGRDTLSSGSLLSDALEFMICN